MQYMIPIGSVVTMLGLAGLFFCIFRVARAKRAGLSDEELSQTLQSTVALNLAALCLSAFGLIMVIVGITLG